MATFWLLVAGGPWASGPLRAQQSVLGEVRNAETGAPVAGATVTVSTLGGQLEKTETSDAQGRFSLVGLESGDFEIVVARESYLTERFNVTVAPRQILKLDIRLSPAAGEHETVEVTASLNQLDAGKAQTSLTLTERSLEELPAPYQTDIPKLVARMVPGAVQGHDNFIHLKGNELSLHQFLDGVAFLDNPQSQFSPGYAPQVIQSVNIITGGMPAEFGNRLGGVLDVVTKSGQTFQGGSLTLGGGTILARDAAVEYGLGSNRWDLYLFTSGFSDGRFLNPPEPREIHDLGYGSRNMLKLGFLPTPKDRLSLLVSAGGTNFELPNTTDEFQQGRDATRRARESSAILRWQRTLSPRALLNASLYQRYVSNRLVPTSDFETPFARGFRRTLTQGVKVDALFHLGRHNVKAGVDLAMFSLNEDLDFDPRETEEHAESLTSARLSSLMNLGGAPPQAFLTTAGLPGPVFSAAAVEALEFRGRHRGGEGSFYIQDRFSPLPNFTIHAGVRYDRYSVVVTEDLVSPRIGLSYHLPQTGTVFRAVYNRYFVPPPLEYIQLTSAFGTGGIGGGHDEEHHEEEAHHEPLVATLSSGLARTGDEGHDEVHEEAEELLGPVRSLRQHYFEFGFQQPLHRNIVLDVSGYHHQGRNAYENVELSNTRLFLPTTFARERTWGTDVSLRVRPLGRLGVFGYLNYSHAITNFFGPVTGGLEAEEALPGQQITPAFDQRHTGSAAAGYRHDRSGFVVGLGVLYGSGTPTERHVESEHVSTTALASALGFGLPGHVLPGSELEETILVRLPSYWTFDIWTGVTVWKSDVRSVDLQFSVENIGNRIFEIAKESEVTPVQFGGRRRLSGQLRFRF